MKVIQVLSIFFSAVFFWSCGNQAYLFKKEPHVKVKIIGNYNEITITPLGEWELFSNENKLITFEKDDTVTFFLVEGLIQVVYNSDTILTNTEMVRFKPGNEQELLISNVKYGVGWWWEGAEDRYYEGDIYIYKSEANKLDVVVELSLEEYLKGVVPYEIGPDAPMEALKAQAIAARSEAMVALTSKLYSGKNYDLTSDVECQVFSGNKKRSVNTDKAVDETKGLILTENDEPINAYYASNCGGHSELIKNVWPNRKPFNSYGIAKIDNFKTKNTNLTNEKQLMEWINSSPDVFCNPENGIELPLFSQQNFRWVKQYELSAVSDMLGKSADIGSLLEVKPIERGVSGRMYQAAFIFEKDTLTVSGELNIRQKWKPALRSSCFYSEIKNDSLFIYGAGWGHGVGMCQSGAISQAKQGTLYPEILRHYYPKAETWQIYSACKKTRSLIEIQE